MTWARVDDRLWCHRKVRLLSRRPDGLAALGLWTVILSHCGQRDSDMVTRDDLDQLLGVNGLRPRSCAKLVDRLVEVEMLAATDDGWRVHDWADYQPRKEYIEAQRERGRRGAEARWRGQKHGDRHASAISQPHGGGAIGVGNGIALTSRSDPDPIPIRSGSRARGFPESEPDPAVGLAVSAPQLAEVINSLAGKGPST